MRLTRLARSQGPGLVPRIGPMVIACMLMSVLAVGTPGSSTEAATPSSGTVSPSHPSLTYHAGPFFVPNPTGDCTDQTQCDQFKLTVDTTSTYADTHSLKVSIVWPTTTQDQAVTDFDLYLLNSKGQQIAASATTNDPEIVTVPAKPGQYTVRVIPYNPGGQSFTGQISLLANPGNPPPAPGPAPSYTNYIPPENLGPNVHGAGEPSIGVNWKTGNVMYQAYTDTYKVNSFHPGGKATWANVSASAAKGCLTPPLISFDPILFTDDPTGRTFESQLIINPFGGFNSLTCYTTDDGKTWNSSQAGGVVQGVDHQTLGGGRPHAGSPIQPLPGFDRLYYYCSHSIEYADCAISQDGGTTFGIESVTHDAANCNLIGALHGHVKVSPKDGTVYLPIKQCGTHQAVSVSEDNGLTWTVKQVPTSTPGSSDPAVGIGDGGRVYFGYQAANGQARIAVSDDHGKTWKYDQDVGYYLGIKNIVFPAVVAGDNDRAAFAFLGTTTGGDYENQANFHGIWHLYIAHTYDGGQHWITSDATPKDPVQRGSICTGGTTCGTDRNLLDFIGIDADRYGRVYVGYADGCTPHNPTPPSAADNVNCVTTNHNNYDALATIARQMTGKTLRAKYDYDLSVTRLTAVQTSSQQSSQTTITATVYNAGNGNAQGVVVRFLVDGKRLADVGSKTVGSHSSVSFKAQWDSTNKQGTHVITAIVDPNNQIPEYNESNNQRSITFVVQ